MAGLVPSPLKNFVPAGVYTRTLAESNVSNITAGLRIPCLIGVGEEILRQFDQAIVRGSSSTIDESITKEDVSDRFVLDETNPNVPVLGNHAGTKTKFRVRQYPIVDGQGIGRTTNSASSVSVTVDGTPVAVATVVGASGYVTLQVPAPEGANIRCTYNIHRNDTVFLDDVSAQVTAVAAILLSAAAGPYTIVTGSSDTFTFAVDGVSSTVTFTAGSHSAAAIKSQLDAAAISGLSTAVVTDAQGGTRIQMTAAKSLVIGSGNANGAIGFTPNQATSRNTAFRVFQRPIVDGTHGGIITTDTSKVTAKVNGVQVIPTSVDGTNGIVTLPSAPAVGSTVTIQYWSNTWQNTFDHLPNSGVTSITRCGFAPGRSDYVPGSDLVVQNPTEDTSVVHWGAANQVTAGTTAPGSTAFDTTQIQTTLVDDKIWLAGCTRYTDTTVVPSRVSSTEFILPITPTTGNGRDTPLGSSLYNDVTNSRIGLDTNRPDLITVYAGHSVQDAVSRAAIPVKSVDASTRHIVLTQDIRPDYTVYATFWYSRLEDNTYSFTSKVAGASGIGQYEVLNSKTGLPLYQVRFGTKTGLSDTVQWPRGVESIPDAFHTGDGTPVAETVTVTFATGVAKNAKFVTPGAQSYLFYASQSDQWRSTINGNALTTDLDTAVRGYLVSSRVVHGGTITITGGTNDSLLLTIDGTDVDVTLTAGARTPAQIVTDINAAIDAAPAFSGTAPNALASTVSVAGDAVFLIRSYSVPAALPGGFDHASRVSLRQGTAETALGFAAFQSASGTPTATVKPATVLGSEVGPFAITSGSNDTLIVRVDGIEYTITLPTGASVATGTIVTAINAVPGLTSVASAGTLGNLNKLRLTSQTTGATSSIEIMGGSANATLGLTQGTSATATAVSAQEVVNELLATASFTTHAVAYAVVLDGSTYVKIESVTTGSSGSTIAFTSGSASAFNTLSGTGIVVGTSGDSGENATNTFTVASNHASGSSGTGVPGQTYTDARTGLRFTILAADDGAYTNTGNFTLIVSPVFLASASVPWLSAGGLEVIVTDTVGVTANNTASLQTFSPSGLEPAVGDVYYISYEYSKTDFSTRLFQRTKAIEANFGPISQENRVSLGSYLAILNGAVLVAIKQVLKQVNTNQATDATFVTAIQELQTPLEGNVKPDLLLPLTTSIPVMSYLMQHCEQMSTMERQAERMGFIGFASGTAPSNAQTVARSLKSARIVALYPDSGVVTLTDEVGQTYEALIDGSIIMTTLAGAVVSPSVDVATPYTRRRLLGISRLLRNMDTIARSQTQTAGITLLEDLGNGFIRVVQGFTTNMDTLLSRLPTVTQIADSVHVQTRSVLDAFVGTKFLRQRLNEVEVSLTSMFSANKQNEVISDYQGIAAETDATNPTAAQVEGYYAPIFPLDYLVVTYNLRSSL